MSDPSINVASLSLSRKALSKLLQSKISAEILALTGLKKLPEHVRKTIKKAGKKISSELHSGTGDNGNNKDTEVAVKSPGEKPSPGATAKVKTAKKEMKPTKPVVAKKAIKIAKPKVAKKAPGKVAVAKKAVNKAVKKPAPGKDKPVENPDSTQ